MTNKKTTLVMLPGLDGTGDVFGPLIDCLPESIETLVVRYPTDKVMSFEEHVEFARATLPADKPFVLLAESFSGPIGVQLLADAPENLLGVIFVATFDRYPSPFILDMSLQFPPKLMHVLFKSTPIGSLLCLAGASRTAVQIFKKALNRVTTEVLFQRLKILAKLPPPPELSDQIPCLYLQATHDRLVPERAAARLQRHLPQLQVKSMSAPHILLLAKAQQGADAIGDFIDSMEAG